MTGRSPGLQPERTALAWHRTAMSGTGLACVALLGSASSGRWWLIGVCAAVAGVTAALAVLCSDPTPGARWVHHGVSGAPATSVWFRLCAGSTVVVLLAATGVLLCLVG